jgi:Integrase core domain
LLSRHVKTLMRRMGIEALYRRPRSTKPEPGHKIHRYLLRGKEMTRPNQVWAMDITHIPMARGFAYLAVVLDWASRRVLSWRVSITMEAAFCVQTPQDAFSKPEIFNTDRYLAGQRGWLRWASTAIEVDVVPPLKECLFIPHSKFDDDAGGPRHGLYELPAVKKDIALGATSHSLNEKHSAAI